MEAGIRRLEKSVLSGWMRTTEDCFKTKNSACGAKRAGFKAHYYTMDKEGMLMSVCGRSIVNSMDRLEELKGFKCLCGACRDTLFGLEEKNRIYHRVSK